MSHSFICLDKNLSPEERLKCLISYTSTVEIDPNVSAKLYYRSGLNMFKQFNIYYKDGSWENALCIYLKYELLFFDKIKKHPEFKQIPVNVKSVNAANFRLMKIKAEHSKRALFKQYNREYMSYCEELRRNKGNEQLEDIQFLENSKGCQTMPKSQLGRSKEPAKNLKKGLSVTSKTFQRSSEVFRPNNTQTVNRKLSAHFEEPKTTKGGSEVFKSKTITSKAGIPNTPDKRISANVQDLKGIKDGGEGVISKNTSLKPTGNSIIYPKLSAHFPGSKKGSNELFKSKTTDNFYNTKSIDIGQIVSKLEGTPNCTAMTDNDGKAPGKKKSKDLKTEVKTNSKTGYIGVKKSTVN